MRIYDRGVRRRLAPMLGGDERRLALAHSLLFGLPGTPVMWYGDEIGMGEDLGLPERWPVRTPMQWSDAAAMAAFRRPRADLVVPPVSEGPQAFAKVNVEAQKYEPDVAAHPGAHDAAAAPVSPEIGHGDWRSCPACRTAVLGLSYTWRGRRLVILANFAESVVDLPAAALPEGRGQGRFSSPRVAAGGSIDLQSVTLSAVRLSVACACRMSDRRAPRTLEVGRRDLGVRPVDPRPALLRPRCGWNGAARSQRRGLLQPERSAHASVLVVHWSIRGAG